MSIPRFDSGARETYYDCVNHAVIESVSGAVQAVLDESGFEETSLSSFEDLADGATPDVQVSISVGLTGAAKGFLWLSFTQDAAMACAERLGSLMGIEIAPSDTISEMHRAALAELANQVAGRTTMHLADRDLDANITPPTILVGSRVALGVTSGMAVAMAHIATRSAQFTVMVGQSG